MSQRKRGSNERATTQSRKPEGMLLNLGKPRSRVRYTDVVDAIAGAIESGRLTPNQRLPTQRDLAQREGIAVGTVSRAYAEAERLGLIVGEVGRGTFVSPVHSTSAPAHEVLANSLDLTINRPPPQGALNAFRAALRSLAASADLGRLLGHQPVPGMEHHRAAAAHWISGTGLSPAAEQVVICNGVQHALAALFGALAKPGDVVLTEELNYPGIRLVGQLFGLRIHGLPMDGEGLLPDALKRASLALGARFIFCTPTVQNPTAAVMSRGRREAIAAVVESRNLTLIEDDIYGLMLRERMLPLAALIPDRSFYVTGTSKCIAEGVRLGYVVAPRDYVAQVITAVQATTWMPSAIIGEIVSRWLIDGTADAIVGWHRDEAAARQALARQYLDGYHYSTHPAAYHLWLDLPEPWRSGQFVSQARQRGVLIVPAETFVIGRNPAPHAVRISLGGLDERRSVERGLRTLAALLAERPSLEQIAV
jgi:DNA-binding transcriptional MocR family regulator